MAKKADLKYAFYQELWLFYNQNRGKIRSRYKDLTKKFLAYNDKTDNPKAYLRKPQFEALEMYVFIKEFMGNPQVYDMFDDWRNSRGQFSEESFYALTSDKYGQTRLGVEETKELTDTLFKQMKEYSENYPNYIYALTMGLGKTILMATCIFYEFLLANKYPKDKRYCHNALVFAPDKTVLQSLREIMTFDKELVVPKEYARVLDANIKFHFLEESGTMLHTIDDSNFNIVISNTQKIIVKKKRAKSTPTEQLFSGMDSLLYEVYGNTDDEAWDDTTLLDNQRFKKLCRLPQLGVYVDEAHHLFGTDLVKQIRSDKAKKTSLRDTINLLADNTSIVACYNYTGTPYVKNQILPEVVYAYGLKESIWNGYLKDADPIAYENVKSEEFLKFAVTTFWERYGNKKYEGLNPKLAIYASGVEEAANEVRPTLERILSDLGIPTSKILLNVGNAKYTKDTDIRNFNNLDVAGSQGDDKQFVILVEKGKEGWNCRSLFSVAMFREPKSKVFVLQATMRCLRAITDVEQQATVFLSKANYDILDSELNKNFNMNISDITNKSKAESKEYKVRVLPPPRKIKLKKIKHIYSLDKKECRTPVDFGLKELDCSKYESKMYEKETIAVDTSVKVKNIDDLIDKIKFSELTLVGEIARYLNISCIKISHILKESVDGVDLILEKINKYNDILYDVIIPKIFYSLFEVNKKTITQDKEILLLKEPSDKEFYTFSGKKDLVITNTFGGFSSAEIAKSFHADTYCFDSLPERECFFQYIRSDKVSEIYFTGMFTSNQTELSVQYYDPETRRIRQYYPDFLAKMKDGTYQIIEVKGDNMIDDTVVKAKAEAAQELAVVSGLEYKMYPGSVIMNQNVLDNSNNCVQQHFNLDE